MDDADLAYAGLARQSELVASGEVSARELVDVVLERIERLDPVLNAYRVVFGERALEAAGAADARRKDGVRAPLLGVPVAIKDDVDVAGEFTAMGTDAHGPPAARDAEVVRRLRAAGAILVGKTNVPELTIVPFTETPTYGKTRNPWSLRHTPGGSSGGSAAAVAAGLAGAALGSDGGGSIRIPAANCGLFGLKPQRDRIPLVPLRESWHGLSVLGPLTRSVADCASFHDAVKDGAGSFAEAAARAPGRLRIATSFKVPPPMIAPLGDEQRAAVEGTAELLRSLGHEVVERDPDYGRAFYGVIARYLRGIHDAAAAIPHPERLSRQTRGYARMGALVPRALLARLRAAEAADAARINAIFDDGFDVLLTPVFARGTLRIGEYEGRSALWTFSGTGRYVPYTAAFNHTGQPAASVPAGFAANGLPLAVQLVGRPDDEPTLLSLSAQLEAARPWAEQRPPHAP
jgi:amidase